MADRRRRSRSTHRGSSDGGAATEPSADPSLEASTRDPNASPSGDEAAPQTSQDAAAHHPFGLEGLAIAGITRRRAGWTAATVFTMWVVLVFARQVGDASARSSQVDQRRAENAALGAEVAALQDELVVIQEQAYIGQQAHAYRLGDEHDRPFTLSGAAPPLAANAPGSAAGRLGAVRQRRSPLESWLSILFGPGR